MDLLFDAITSFLSCPEFPVNLGYAKIARGGAEITWGGAEIAPIYNRYIIILI